MKSRIASATVLAAALFLAGCGETLEDIAPKAERQLPAHIVQTMKAKGMSKGSPIMMRIFKEEGVLEVWKQKHNGRYEKVTSYDICKWSGKLGPKYTEGDRQAPEGFYRVGPAQMNPKSSYHLAFNIGFPNNYDRANGRSGQHLMVHGACSSAGCYSMTDEQVEEIYAFARDAFRGGQQAFQVQAFPFRMTAENMARYEGDPNYDYWKMLKEGYDHFEITKQPPKVDVCERRYVFNRVPAEGAVFSPTEMCPPSRQPESLVTAYQSYQKEFAVAFAEAKKKRSKPERKPSILGHKEAVLVADWSKRRARGERVSAEPPSLAPVAVAAAAPPQSTPVTAFRAETASDPAVGAQQTAGTSQTTVSDARSQVGAPQVQAEALPVPTPNPSRFGGSAESAAEPAASRLSRIWSLFGN